MATHGVARDGLASVIDGELRGNEGGKLLGDVRVHVVVLLPLVGGGIDVEASARAEVVALILTLDVSTAGGGVRGDNGEAKLGGNALGASLGGEVLIIAGETAEVVHYGDLGVLTLGREKDGELHLQVTEDGGGVGKLLHPSAKGLVLLHKLESHLVF